MGIFRIIKKGGSQFLPSLKAIGYPCDNYMKEFNLKEIKNKQVKELTNHEFYLRYKKSIKNTNKKNYNKYDFAPYSKKYSQKNKEKINAKAIANYHIKIPEGQICIKCNKKLATDKHHEDYNKPKEVEFLCKKCHGGTRVK